MITIQSGKMIIPEEERFVGFAGDNHSSTKQFFLSGGADGESSYTLYLKFDDGRVTSAPLTAAAGDDGLVLTWDVSSLHLLKAGVVMAQLRIAGSDGVVSHTGWDYFVVASAAELADDGSEVDILHRAEFEERMAQAVRDARAIAPYIGQDGYWYVYSPVQDEYVRSFSANNIVVDDAVSADSANPVENRAVKAYVDAADSAKVDKTTKIAGIALSGSILSADLYENMAPSINPRMVTIGTTPGYPAQYGKTTDNEPVFCRGLNRWEKLAQMTDIPVKTSDLTNDSGFLTQHQDISGKVDKTRTIAGVDLQDDVTASELQTALSVPARISQLANDENVPTQGYTKVYFLSGYSQYFDGSFAGSAYDPRVRLGDIIVHNGAMHICTAFSEYMSQNQKRYNYTIALIGKLPRNTSDLTNDSGFLTQHQDISGLMQLAVTVSSDDTTDVPMGQVFKYQNNYYIKSSAATPVGAQLHLADADAAELSGNKVTSLSSSSTDTQYPSAKCVYDLIGDIESLLAGV